MGSVNVSAADSSSSGAAPRVSIVVPTYNRSKRLRRALASVASQTFADFECIVVDDASTEDITPIVAEFDDRFRLVRRDINGGCSAARLYGFGFARGEYAMTLDSDNELLPWALSRAVLLLDLPANLEVGGVTGQYIFPDGLRNRVRNQQHLVTPAEYMSTRPRVTHDAVGVVRKPIVGGWLSRRCDYYNLDFQMWFSFQLKNAQLYVDEPWGRYHIDANDRITDNVDPRKYQDPVKFVEQYRPELGARECLPLDRFLGRAWTTLWRAGKIAEARHVRSWIDERHIGVAGAVVERGIEKMKCYVRRGRSTSPQWL
jgi:glycosyltransferase involved in cell wall biosynthesis